MNGWTVVLGIMAALAIGFGIAIYVTVEPDPEAGAPGSRPPAVAPSGG